MRIENLERQYKEVLERVATLEKLKVDQKVSNPTSVKEEDSMSDVDEDYISHNN